MRSYVNLREETIRSPKIGDLGSDMRRFAASPFSQIEGGLSGQPLKYDRRWRDATESTFWPLTARVARGPTGISRQQTIDLSHLGLAQSPPERVSIPFDDWPVVVKFKPSTIHSPDTQPPTTSIGVSPVMAVSWPPQRQKLAHYAIDLQTNWIRFQPQVISFDPPPAIARFEPPPSYYRRVARPMTEILTLVDHARLDPENAFAYQEEAWRKSEEAMERFRNGVESWHMERALTTDLRPSAVSHMLAIAPDALQAGALFYRVLTNSGFATDSTRRVCLPVQMLDRSTSATADLQGWLPPLETALGILGGVSDYSNRLRVARAYTDDGLRAWSIATGDFIAERGTALALGVLGSYVLAAIPGVGPFLALGLSLFSGALAKRLTAPLPMVS